MNTLQLFMGFFYISAPYLQGSREGSVRQICDVVIRKHLAQGKQVRLQRQKFKLANLDTLMSSNDKLLKVESGIESFLKKIDKQYLDLQEKTSHNWYVRLGDNDHPVKSYVRQFRWNDPKYPRTYPIQRIVQTFEIKLNNIENELRNKTNSYNETKSQLAQLMQKEGNYYVKDLNDILVEPFVSADNFIYTKFITTVIVIVHENSIEQFLSKYELFSQNVIPNSAYQFKSIQAKDGLTIWKVNLFNIKAQPKGDDADDKKKEKRNLTVIQQFIEKSREHMKVVVKQFKFESGLSDTRRKKREALESKLKTQTKTVSELCSAYFSEMFQMYIHAKILRSVIQSNMRFGSDKTVFYAIETMPGKEKNVQSLLVDIFGDKESEGLYGTKDEIDDGQDFFPFIYVPALLF